jgi:hypothetical protein
MTETQNDTLELKAMFAIETLPSDPNRLLVTVDGLFRAELIRREQHLSINVYAAKTDQPLTETWVADNEALEDQEEQSDPPLHKD